MKFAHFSVLIVASSLVFCSPLYAQAQSNVNNNSSTINRPDLNMGSRGEFVQELQAALKLLGFYDSTVDGIYGEQTALAVTRFQQNALLNANGLVNQQTWNRLFPVSPNNIASTPTTPSVTVATSPPNNTNNTNTPPTNPTPTNSTPTNPTPTNTNPPNNTNRPNNNTPVNSRTRAEDLPLLKEGMEGDAVKLLQARLKALGFYNGDVDGIFGRNTLQAVIAAQIYFRLDGDGIVGLQTWKKVLGQS
jgi:N-acetylmuramoyl-L-alanine amidase